MNDQVATLNFLHCHEDLATGAKRGMSFLGLFGMLNSQLLFTREAYPTTAYQSLGGISAPAASKGGGNPGAAYGVPDGVCIGDPKAIIEAIKRWESVGVDQLNFLVNACEVLPQEQVLESLRLFAREVMPAFERGKTRRVNGAAASVGGLA